MTEYNKLHNKNDIIGKVFNKWTVISYSHKHKISGNWYYNCKCECGTNGVVSASSLRTGGSKQCKICSSKINGKKGTYSKSSGDLYIIRVLDYIKIGCSKNVKRRIKDINSASPFEAILIYHGINEGKNEELWHKAFEHMHHKGEWYFFPCDEQEQNNSAKYNKTDCILECYYDKELQACGSCYRTLEEIAEAGKKKRKKLN